MRCPNCGREVEAGFRFCDGCGTRLPESVEPPEPARAAQEQRPTGPPPPAGPSAPPAPAPPTREVPKQEPSEAAVEERSEAKDRPSPPTPPPPPPAPATEETEAGRRVGIGGWLRRSDTTPTETRSAEPTVPVPPPPTPTAPPPPPPPRSAPGPAGAPRLAVAELLWFVLHLVVSFAAGVVLVGLAAAITTLATGGSFALLDLRGVPVFLGVATSILVLALLRSRFRSADPRRDWVLVAVGFIVLVLAGVFVYSPLVLERAQASLERGLGVWGADDEAAVRDFRGSVVSWNQHVGTFERVARDLDEEDGVEAFRAASSEAEEAMGRSLEGMRAAAASAGNAELADSLAALADAYDGQLSGFRMVIEGLLTDDFGSIEEGNDSYRQAREQVDIVFEERLRPVLERGELDADAFARAISG